MSLSFDPGAYTAGMEQLERDALELQRALDEVRGEAESADGLVHATTNGRGELIDLFLDPRIYRTADAGALAADIRSTIRAAVVQAQADVLQASKASLFPAGKDPAEIDLEFDALLEHVRTAKGELTP
ncbi:YbaB/EbfC family nucleoid-associated protein [Kribbella sp. NPDC055071]